MKQHNSNWPRISYKLYRILIIGSFWCRKTNSLFNLINYQPDIDKIYLFPKDHYEAKYQLLINKRESTALKYLNDSKVFTE